MIVQLIMLKSRIIRILDFWIVILKIKHWKKLFYANEQGSGFSNMESQNNLLDDFAISKKNIPNNN